MAINKTEGPQATQMFDLDSMIASTQSLAPLPKSCLRLAAVFGQDDWQLEDVAAILRLDPPSTGRLLARANSAALSSHAAITDVRDAVMRIGAGPTMSLILGGAVKQDLAQPQPAYGLCEGSLWRHSVAVALAVERVGVVLRCPTPPEAFAVAILHDIGKLVLGRYLSSDASNFIRRSRTESGVSLPEAESEIIAVHHGEVGGLIAQHWSLPEPIVFGVIFHHDPESAPTESARRICELVALGDRVANCIGAGDEEREQTPLGFVNENEVSQEAFDTLCEDVSGLLDQVQASYD